MPDKDPIEASSQTFGERYAERLILARSVRAMFLVGLAVLVLWFLAKVVLLLFAASLVAILIEVPSSWLSDRLGIRYGFAMAMVLTLIPLAVGGAGYALAPRVITQVQQVESSLPQDLERVVGDLRNTPVGHLTVGQLSGGSNTFASALLQPVLSSISSIADALGSIVFVLFIGVFLAATPRLYENGFLYLIPNDRVRRAGEIVRATAATLKYFLAGRLFSMTVIGICSAIGLWALGIPAAIALAVLAGVLSFVPYVGSALSGVPPFLIAYARSPTTAVFVIALYVAIHVLDGYILVPLVQRRTVDLGPALTLTAQLAFGILWGILGVSVATPIIAALTTIVRMAYVEDVLKKP